MADERLPDATVTYTDGACINNPGPGGWAWAIPGGAFRSGHDGATTNQRMELTAAFEAMLANPGPLHIVSDSTYVVNCFQKRWYEGWLKRNWLNSQKQPVANQDLWKPTIEHYLEREHEISFEWVKGHSGNRWNDVVDRLATDAAKTQTSRDGDEPATDLGDADDPRGASRAAASTDAPANAAAAGLLAGYTVAVFGHRPPQLGGYDETNPIAAHVRRKLSELLNALATIHGDMVLVSGLGLGTEQMAAEVAAQLGIDYAAALPYPDPDKVWPAASRERFATLMAGARATMTKTPTAPATRQDAGRAAGDRDSWLAANCDAAVVVWDGIDRNLGKLVDSLERRDIEIHLINPAK